MAKQTLALYKRVYVNHVQYFIGPPEHYDAQEDMVPVGLTVVRDGKKIPSYPGCVSYPFTASDGTRWRRYYDWSAGPLSPEDDPNKQVV